MVKRALPLPRHIKPGMISEGDTVRFSWKHLDVEHSRVAKIARIRHQGGKVFYYSPQGEVIICTTPGEKITLTLLAEADNSKPEPLFEMEKP